MWSKIENYQAQFSGFFKTPHLFCAEILGMQPFLKQLQTEFSLNTQIKPNIRLGQRVEQFVFEELKQFNTIKILSENAQIINKDRLTIGELDCLYLEHEQVFHLEIQYKFYLFDPNVGTTELDHCIGPNRKDTLIQKLNKLKTKQLPLLYANDTKPLLEYLQIKANAIKQQLYFKAQLFMPYGENIQLKTLNNDCVYGFYFKFKNLPDFKNCKFYIPKKLDWLVDVHPNVDWQNYKQVLPQLETFFSEQYAPMIWLKKPNGTIYKCFVIWW